MKQGILATLKSFLLELLVYGVLVTAYYLLVLHFLGPALKQIYQQDRRYYAGLALALIIGQGFLLEVLTRVLLGWIRPRTED
jgi:hypothetical protein